MTIAVLAVLSVWSLGAVGESTRPLLENTALRVEFDANLGGLCVTDKRTGQVWNQFAAPREGFGDFPRAALRSFDSSAGTLTLEVPLCGVRRDGKPEAAPCELVVSLRGDEAEVNLSFTPHAEGEWIDAAYPAVFALSGADASVLVPHSEGLLAPVRADSPDFIDIGKDYIYGGWGAYCACLGLVDVALGHGMLYVFDDPVLAGYEPARIDADGTAVVVPRVYWRASKFRLEGQRRIRLLFEDRGGYVALAKRYAAWYAAQGWRKTLKQKVAENPTVDGLVGAPVFWIFKTPGEVLETVHMLKADGIDRALIEVGFTNYAVVPGGDKEDAELEGVVREIRELGYVVSRYDQYRDAFKPDPQESPYNQINTDAYPDACVKEESGALRPSWFPGFVINPACGLELARKHISEDLARHPYNGRFIDCMGTCSFWEAEDWDPAHLLDAHGARKAREELLRYVNGLGLVVGSEGGIDCLLSGLHWLEGPMSLVRWTARGLPLPGWDPVPEFPEYKVSIGTRYRIPFFSLVHHDEIMITGRWEDGNTRLPRYRQTKNLWSMLYGNPPMFFLNRDSYVQHRKEIVDTCRMVCPWTRKVGYAELLSHRFVTADRSVQESTFSTGERVVVNFSETSRTLSNGESLPAMDYRIFALDGSSSR